jgi:hypothetical protein
MTIHPDQPGFSYAQVERALVTALDIDVSWLIAFRGRLKNFQKLGTIGTNPGTGSRVQYSFELAAKLAIVLMMTDIGLAPTLCVQSVDEHWQVLRRRIQQAVGPATRAGENPWFLAIRMEAMRGPWTGRSAIAEIGMLQRNSQDGVLKWLAHAETRNLCVLPLSHVLHRLRDEL